MSQAGISCPRLTANNALQRQRRYRTTRPLTTLRTKLRSIQSPRHWPHYSTSSATVLAPSHWHPRSCLRLRRRQACASTESPDRDDRRLFVIRALGGMDIIECVTFASATLPGALVAGLAGLPTDN